MKGKFLLIIFCAILGMINEASAGSTNTNSSGTITAVFSKDNKSVQITDSKHEITSVVLNFSDGNQQEFDKIKNKKTTLKGEKPFNGAIIIGVWVNNSTNNAMTLKDSSGYGEYIMNNDPSTSGNTYQDKCTGKVKICHIPPGNPSNRHTIWVSCNAVPAHIKNHGDSYGDCGPVCTNPTDATAKNVKYSVHGYSYTSIHNGHIKECDTLIVTFTTDSCTKTRKFSLVSYKAPDSVFNVKTAADIALYDSMSGYFGPGTHQLSVVIPCCFFQVDFVYGDIHVKIDKPSIYGTNLIDELLGGYGSCKKKCTTLTDAKAKDIKYSMEGRTYTKLRGNANQGDTVTVTFKTDDCTKDTRFSLVSYQAPDSVFDENTADQQVLFDSMSRIFGPGTHTLSVVLPDCYYQVDFVYGDVIVNLDKHNLYGSRLIDADNGGDGSCQTIPLPVSMVKFEAKQLEPRIVELKWATASEVDNDYFTIEKTSDMANWTPVCRVQGNGNTNVMHEYSCMDSSAGTHGEQALFYRPKQVDFNGKYEYFNTIKLRLDFTDEVNGNVTQVYPNPVTDRINIRYDAKDGGLVHIRLLTMEGKFMLNSHYNVESGKQTIDLNLPENSLSPGMYVLEVENNGQVFRQKIYKQ